MKHHTIYIAAALLASTSLRTSLLTIIEDLFTKSAPAVNMYTKDSPDELKPKLK